ncbi:MAG: T9SS type A sorting domain-containing protein [Lewinellaceae bacterium]|nr:T9SS type A sorting domain-containing protein [Lewinellaceae bacterium]
MKRKLFLPIGHTMPNPQPATRNPQPQPAFLSVRSFFRKTVPILFLIFGVINLNAQSGCLTNQVDISVPASFEICDLDFTAAITIDHDYTATHNYTVTYTYDSNYFTFTGTTPNLSYSTGTDIFGNTVITLTFPAPFSGITPTFAVLEAHFTRDARWSGNDERITYTVSDTSCSPALLFSENPAMSVDSYVDLRNTTETSASELLFLGILESCSQNEAQSILIDEELVVDADHCFDNPLTAHLPMAFQPGVKVTIKAGYTLTLRRMDLFTCGSELAHGIVVESGGTLILDDCNVSDCRFGIDAQAGSTISIINTNFMDNYIGIRLNMDASPFRATIDGFENNSFSTVNGLKTPFSGMPEFVETRGYCGIWLDSFRDFNVWGDNLAGVTNGNQFSALANGIVAYRTTTNMGNMTFDDINSVGAPAYSLSGYGIYLNGKGGTYWANLNEFWTNMSFTNCKTGIKGIRYAGNVENVTMDGVETGIDWEDSKTRDMVFSGNRITASRFGIRSFSNEPVHPASIMLENTIHITGSGAGTMPATAILANEGHFGTTIPTNGGWRILSDTITLDDSGRGIVYRNGYFGNIGRNIITNNKQENNYDGIWVEGASLTQITGNVISQNLEASSLGDSRCIRSAAGWANTYACNCLDNTNAGMQFYDMGDFTDNVVGNLPHNHTYGLQLGDENIGNVFIGTQTHTGNEWDLNGIPSGGYGGVHWGGDQNIIGLSIFYVDGSENAAFNPPVDPPSGWFEDDADENPTFTCGISCSFPDPPQPPHEGEDNVPTKLDAVIAYDTLPTDDFEDETRWKGAYRLYRKMLRQPALATYSSLYSTFKATNDSLSTGRLAYIAERRDKLFNLDSLQHVAFENYRADLLDKVADIDTLEQQHQAGTSINQTQYNTLVQQRATTQNQLEQFMEALDSVRQVRIQSLLQLNAAVTTSLTPDENHKTVNAITLNWLATDELSSTDLATLESIAEQCPLKGGDAVYEARAIISHFEGIEYDDRDLCGTQNRQSRREKSPINNQIIVFPNPASDQINWTDPGGRVATIKVLNTLGQLSVEITNTKPPVGIVNLPQGFYVVQLFSADNTLLVAQKIQIVKH